MALTSAQRVELIQKMYVAYYGRPADTGGLDNWINHLVQHNDDASAIIQAFGTSPEATSLYGEPVNYALAVNALYMQMFNRPAEPDGLALYVAHLNAGRVTLPNLALTIATGAQNADRDTFLNKVEVATAFTAEVATSTENILGYAGEDAAAHAAAFLAGVDNTDASVTAALADLESTIDTIIGLDQLSSLPTHTLTTGLDNLLGTNGNDVVLAVLDGDDSTLELDDAFNALMGQDTLRLDNVVAGSNVDFDSSDYHFVGFERVLVQSRAEDLDLYLDLNDMVGVDLEVRNMLSSYDGPPWANAELYAENIGGDVLVTNFDGYDLDLNNVGGDVVLRGIYVDNNNNDNAVDINTVGGDLLIEDFELNRADLEIDDVAGSVTLTGDVDSNGNINSNIDNYVGIDGVGGNVTISNTHFDDNLDIVNISGNTVTFSNVDLADNSNIEFADTVTSATINLNGLSQDNNSNEWIDVDGVSVTNYTFNVTADSDISELHLSHDNNALSAVTVNLNADLTIDQLEVASSDENSNDIASTITVKGSGDLIVNSITNDDNLTLVYTGSGSIQIGSEDGNSSWEPEVGSFNASSATGDVTVYLDLNDSNLDFTYAGSKGSDRVDIENEGSLGEAAVGEDVVALSLNGGAGTDTLVVSTSDDLTEEAMAVVSNFEVLELDLAEGNGDQTFDLDFADEFDALVLADGNGNDINLVNLSADLAGAITILASDENCNVMGNLTVSLENSTGANDAVSITYVHDNNCNENDIIDTLYLDDIEHLTINMTGDAYYLDGNGDINLDNPITDLAINDINSNDLETLTISGSVSLDILDLNTSDDLRSIDARAFTGLSLGLGTEGVVWTDDDLIIQGSLTADHYIDVNGNEDVTITTGSGDDVMYIDALDDLVINAGDGNNDINAWSYDDDITVTTGSGDDDVYVSGGGEGSDYADNVTVTMGAGDDDFDYNNNDIDGDLIVDAGAGDDTVNIYLDSDSNINSITVTLGTGADDLWLDNTSWDSNNDVVVTVTDFAVAEDVLYLDENTYFGEGAEYVTVGTQDGDYDVTDGFSSGDIGVIEFTFDADNNDVVLDIDSTGADLLEALGDDGGTAVITVHDDQVGYIVAYNSGNAYVFNYEDTSETDSTVTESNTQNGGDGEDGVTENWTLTLTANQEGFDAGDTISISNIVSSGSGVDFTYTVQQDNTSVTSIANAIANAINDLSGSDFYATFSGGSVYLSSRDDVAYVNNVDISYTNISDTGTIDSGEIELIAVLENVAVGTIGIANIGFDVIL